MLSGLIEPKHPVPAHDQSAGMTAAANLSSFYPLFVLFKSVEAQASSFS